MRYGAQDAVLRRIFNNYNYLQEIPKGNKERIEWLTKHMTYPITPEVRASLEKWYGKDRAAAVQHAEAFEVCEYGEQPTDEQLKRLFPMLGK